MSRITQEDIRRWLQDAKDEGATHVVIKSDDFSHEYYPSPCFSANEARKKVNNPGSMQSIMEVYNLALDWDEQLAERNCRNF